MNPGAPEVTVITPTRGRNEILLGRCRPSVARQDYEGRVWHLIIIDEDDTELVPTGVWLGGDNARPYRFEPKAPEQVNGYGGGIARRFGTTLATTPYLAYLDDDNLYYPSHIRTLVEAIEDSGADFVYSRQRRLSPDGAQVRWVAGDEPPRLGGIDTSLILHRRELLEVCNWPTGPTPPEDALLATSWVRGGAKWHHVPEITMDYYER